MTNRQRQPFRYTHSGKEPGDACAPGMETWLENTRVVLPLRAMDARFEAAGRVAQVTLGLVFVQALKEAADFTFVFPLPAGASVFRCEMEVNGRVVRAVVEELDKARRKFIEAKAGGFRAAFTEMLRDNLFELELGNAQPGDRVTVRFGYVQGISLEGDRMRLRIPFAPCERYVPGKPLLRDNVGTGSADDTDEVPDASRVTPSRIGPGHADAPELFVSGEIRADGVEVEAVSSPSHPLLVRPGEAATRVGLAVEGQFPGSDFVLLWREAAVCEALPRAWGCKFAGEEYALAEVRAPEVEATAEAGLERDLYFLLDRSGSMQGRPWERSCEALQRFVRTCGKGDRVWITCFASAFEDFDTVPLPAKKLLGMKAFTRLAARGADGGTDLFPALRHVLEKAGTHSRGRDTHVVIITDGMVANERALTGLASGQGTRIHLFGLGIAPNDAMATIAEATGGRSVFLHPEEDIVGAVESFAMKLGRPVWLGLKFGPGWEAADPDAPVDVYAGDRVLVPLRKRGKPAPLVAEGTLPGGALHRVEFPLRAVGGEAPALIWGKERIRREERAGRTEEALKVAKAFNLAASGTAFVAWDESEKVQIATRVLQQPSMERECLRSIPAPLGSFGALDGAVLREADAFSTGTTGAPRVTERSWASRPVKRRETRVLRALLGALPALYEVIRARGDEPPGIALRSALLEVAGCCGIMPSGRWTDPALDSWKMPAFLRDKEIGTPFSDALRRLTGALRGLGSLPPEAASLLRELEKAYPDPARR